MTEPYTLPPAKTMDDIEKVISFIEARVKPLRDKAPYNSDTERSHQALLDMVTVTRGVAQSEISHGADPVMPYFHLTIAARQWRHHPDFLPQWAC